MERGLIIDSLEDLNPNGTPYAKAKSDYEDFLASKGITAQNDPLTILIKAALKAEAADQNGKFAQ